MRSIEHALPEALKEESGYEYLRRRGTNAAWLALGFVRTRFSHVDFGRRPVLRGRVRFDVKGKARIGDQFEVYGYGAGVVIKVPREGRLTIGNRTALNAGVSIEAWHEVSIGSHVLMAPFSSLIDDDRHEVEPGSQLYKGPTVIGDNVWIGRSVAVMPGVTIGHGSVIGANSVVTRDIPANSFAAGSPARVIRELDVPEGWVRYWP